MGIAAKTIICVATFLAVQSLCHGQGILCTHGEGRFSMMSKTNVTVIVDAQKENGLSTRACEAKLVWDKEETPVARDAWQADVDVMDVDLGLGAPAVAFQVKKTDIASNMTYEIYLLRGAPRLFRTIAGGDFFRAADTDLDGRIEIWTGDANAANGFEGVPLADFDFPPTIVMRFEKRRLIDVSSEFRSYYDRQITQLLAQLDSEQLSDFKSSGAKLDTIPPWQVEKKRRLMAAKIGVLEIVWAYLYSGREQEAWKTLGEMWPETDIDRIRASIVKARAAGISRQMDGVSQEAAPVRKANRTPVYDLTAFEKSVNLGVLSKSRFPEEQTSQADQVLPKYVAMPKAISLFSLAPSDSQQGSLRSEVLVDLVIDAAGKVSSARLMHKEDEGPIGESLIAAAGHWKFIPAMEYGQPVASHIRITVSPYQ